MNFIRTLFLMLCMGAALAQPVARPSLTLRAAPRPSCRDQASGAGQCRQRRCAPHAQLHLAAADDSAPVDGYQVDKNFNKCMDCHSRTKAEVSQAVPVSVTHYMDRDGHMLGQVSTRRYFCMQCHVARMPSARW
jgi:cytochrome c-type protein NapB